MRFSTAATKKPAGPGAFLGPTVLTDVPVKSSLGETEIFGPVLTLASASGLDEALATLRAAPTATPRRSSRRAASPPALPLRGAGRQHRRQYRCRGTDGVLSVQRLEGQLLRRSCTARGGTASSSTRTRKSWSNGGRRSGRVNSEAPCQVLLQTGFSVLSGFGNEDVAHQTLEVVAGGGELAQRPAGRAESRRTRPADSPSGS